MKAKRKMKKTSVAITAAALLLAGSFATACAENYSFLIVRNVTSTGGEQVWKTEDGAYAEVTVGSASSPSSYTTYKIYNYDDLISFSTELKNTSGNSGSILYQYGARNSNFVVGLRGIDARGTAPNYSTVSGTWKPTK